MSDVDNISMPAQLQKHFLNELSNFEKVTGLKIIHVVVYGSRMQGMDVDGSDWDIGLVYDLPEGYPNYLDHVKHQRFRITHSEGTVDVVGMSKVAFAIGVGKFDPHCLTLLGVS